MDFDERRLPVVERPTLSWRKMRAKRECQSGTERRNGSPGMLMSCGGDHRMSSFSIGFGRR